MAIIKRLEKGSELTYAELDGNFTQLDTGTSYAKDFALNEEVIIPLNNPKDNPIVVVSKGYPVTNVDTVMGINSTTATTYDYAQDFNTTITPSATSGAVSVTFSSGDFNSSAENTQEMWFEGNGATGYISGATTLQLETPFNDLSTLAMGDWHLYKVFIESDNVNSEHSTTVNAPTYEGTAVNITTVGDPAYGGKQLHALSGGKFIVIYDNNEYGIYSSSGNVISTVLADQSDTGFTDIYDSVELDNGNIMLLGQTSNSLYFSIISNTGSAVVSAQPVSGLGSVNTLSYIQAVKLSNGNIAVVYNDDYNYYDYLAIIDQTGALVVDDGTINSNVTENTYNYQGELALMAISGSFIIFSHYNLLVVDNGGFNVGYSIVDTPDKNYSNNLSQVVDCAKYSKYALIYEDDFGSNPMVSFYDYSWNLLQDVTIGSNSITTVDGCLSQDGDSLFVSWFEDGNSTAYYKTISPDTYADIKATTAFTTQGGDKHDMISVDAVTDGGIVVFSYNNIIPVDIQGIITKEYRSFLYGGACSTISFDTSKYSSIESISVQKEPDASVYYLLSPDGINWYKYHSSQGARKVVTQIGGVWKYNSDTSAYSAETFVSGNANDLNSVLATGIYANATNQMDTYSIENLGSSELALLVSDKTYIAVFLYPNSTSDFPTVYSITYTGTHMANQMALVGTDFEMHQENNAEVKIKALIAENLRIRIV